LRNATVLGLVFAAFSSLRVGREEADDVVVAEFFGPSDERSVIDGMSTPLSETNAQHWRESLRLRLREADGKLAPGYGLGGKDTAAWRLKRFELQRALEQSEDLGSMPPGFSQAEIDRC
jgi:hypothetical protein